MKHFIYCTRDKKLGAYNEPTFSKEDKEHTIEGTIRGLKLVSPSEVSRAADHSLYFLGVFDDVSGKFELVEQEEKLLDYEDYVPRKEGGA